MEKAGPTLGLLQILSVMLVKKMRAAHPSFFKDTVPRKMAIMPFPADSISSVY